VRAASQGVYGLHAQGLRVTLGQSFVCMPASTSHSARSTLILSKPTSLCSNHTGYMTFVKHSSLACKPGSGLIMPAAAKRSERGLALT
jgi:hypothetical protein